RQAVWAQLDPGRTRAPAGAEPHSGNGAGHGGAARNGASGNGTSPGLVSQTSNGPSRITRPENITSNGSTSSPRDVARPGAGWPGDAGAADGPGGGAGPGRWGASAPGWPPDPRAPGRNGAIAANPVGAGRPGRDGAMLPGAELPGAVDPRAAWARYAL